MGRRKTSTAHVKIRLVSDHTPCHRTRSQSPRLAVQIVHSGLDAFSQVNLTHQVERFPNPLDFISCSHLIKSPQKHFEREGLFRKGNSSFSSNSSVTFKQTSQIFSFFSSETSCSLLFFKGGPASIKVTRLQHPC